MSYNKTSFSASLGVRWIVEKWNGLYEGQLAEIGTYMYTLSFKGAKGRLYQQKGDITLIR